MKYQCNVCGKIHDRERDANDCHPDVIEIADDAAAARELAKAEDRLAEEGAAAYEAGGQAWADWNAKALNFDEEA